MRAIIVLVFFAFFAFRTDAQNIVRVTTKAEKVTVFLKGAQIERQARINLPKGRSTVLIENLSPFLNEKSIQVRLLGKCRVMSVNPKINYLVYDSGRVDQKIVNELDTLQNRKSIVQSILLVYRTEETILNKNIQIASQTNGIKPLTLKETFDLQHARMKEVKLKIVDLENQISRIDQRMRLLTKQLGENRPKAKYKSEVYVDVAADEAGTFELSIAYLVDRAGWKPSYDIRATDIGSPLILTYKANVFQSTDENWKDVMLTLSTADPYQLGNKPEVLAWTLAEPVQYRPSSPVSYSSGNASTEGMRVTYTVSGNQVKGRIISTADASGFPGVNILIKGTSTGTISDMDGNFTLTLPTSASELNFSFIGFESKTVSLSSNYADFVIAADVKSLEEVVVIGYGTQKKSRKKKSAEKEEVMAEEDKFESRIENIVETNDKVYQTSVSFEIKVPYSVPSDNREYSVDIKEHQLKADYRYFVVPKLDPDVFLTARVTGWEDLNLLPGQANLYYEETYLGPSVLDLYNVGDTLVLSLGRDKEISVKRTKMKDFSDRKFIGLNQKITQSWEISIRNTKKFPVSIVVEDQYPLSSRNDIEVERLGAPEASLKDETGKLTWKIELEPLKEKKLNFKYLVKCPKGITLDL
jgi:hypothetical protein